MKGVDYSWSRPGGAAIKAAGFDFVMRYLATSRLDGRRLEQEELVDLHSNGLGVGVVFETNENRPLGGYAAGQTDASVSKVALSVLSAPETMPVYFAVDFDAQPFHFPVIDEYLRGCASVLGQQRVGVYGSYAVVEHCHEAGSAAWFWQTYAWSSGQKSSWRHVYQYSNGETLNGASVDYNEAYGEFGGWFPEEEDMTPEEVNKLVETFVGATFPAYIEAYFAGGFSARNGVKSDLNPEGKGPIKPWLEDIHPCGHATLPGVAADQ